MEKKLHIVHSPAGLTETYAFLIAFNINSVDFQFQPKPFSYFKDNKEFKQISQFGKVPVLELPDKTYIQQSSAILRYAARLGDKKLYGEGPLQMAQVDQWLDFNILELRPACTTLICPIFGALDFNQERYNKAIEDLNKCFGQLDSQLKVNTYLVGNQLTIADIAIVCTLQPAFRFVLEEKFRKNYENVIRWFGDIAKIQPFQKYFGKPYFCKQEWKFAESKKDKKKEEKQPQQQQQQKTDEQKEKQQKKPQQKPQPQQQQQQQAQKPVQDDDEDKPKEKKEGNPLDLLPQSNFILYNFKTFFVNEPNKAEAVKKFWTEYDPEGFSIWLIKYQRGNQTFPKLFLASNLKDGFLQKIDDKFRKYAFGTWGIYGNVPNLEMRGVWVWRGTQIPQEIKDHEAYDYHTFTKLDHTKAEHKELLASYWTGWSMDESVAEGLIARDVSYYK